MAHTGPFRYASRMDTDIRWKQRLANFRKAFGRLDDAVLLSRQRDLSDLERQGLIQDGEAWMEMLRSRNQSSHTYNLETAAEITRAIDERYWAAFRLFIDSMDARARWEDALSTGIFLMTRDLRRDQSVNP